MTANDIVSIIGMVTIAAPVIALSVAFVVSVIKHNK